MEESEENELREAERQMNEAKKLLALLLAEKKLEAAKRAKQLFESRQAKVLLLQKRQAQQKADASDLPEGYAGLSHDISYEDIGEDEENVGDGQAYKISLRKEPIIRGALSASVPSAAEKKWADTMDGLTLPDAPHSEVSSKPPAPISFSGVQTGTWITLLDELEASLASVQVTPIISDGDGPPSSWVIAELLGLGAPSVIEQIATEEVVSRLQRLVPRLATTGPFHTKAFVWRFVCSLMQVQLRLQPEVMSHYLFHRHPKLFLVEQMMNYYQIDIAAFHVLQDLFSTEAAQCEIWPLVQNLLKQLGTCPAAQRPTDEEVLRTQRCYQLLLAIYQTKSETVSPSNAAPASEAVFQRAEPALVTSPSAPLTLFVIGLGDYLPALCRDIAYWYQTPNARDTAAPGLEIFRAFLTQLFVSNEKCLVNLTPSVVPELQQKAVQAFSSLAPCLLRVLEMTQRSSLRFKQAALSILEIAAHPANRPLHVATTKSGLFAAVLQQIEAHPSSSILQDQIRKIVLPIIAAGPSPLFNELFQPNKGIMDRSLRYCNASELARKPRSDALLTYVEFAWTIDQSRYYEEILRNAGRAKEDLTRLLASLVGIAKALRQDTLFKDKCEVDPRDKEIERLKHEIQLAKERKAQKAAAEARSQTKGKDVEPGRGTTTQPSAATRRSNTPTPTKGIGEAKSGYGMSKKASPGDAQGKKKPELKKEAQAKGKVAMPHKGGKESENGLAGIAKRFVTKS